MDNSYKIETIIRSDFLNWRKMTKEQLLDIMIEDRRFFLETELEYGNEEYLDELLEEIDVPEVWAHAL
jgi:radical SAM superfamily enzyme YgiQ (UPF0313 family)